MMTKKTMWTLAAACAAAATGVTCTNQRGVSNTGGAPSGSASPDAVTSPKVIATSPTDGASGIPVGAPDLSIGPSIVVTFDRDMEPSTFAESAFVFDGASQAERLNRVASTVTIVDARTLELRPDAPLRERATYWVVVESADGGAKDSAGNGLTEDHVFSFTTEALPAVRTTSPTSGATAIATNARILIEMSEPLAQAPEITTLDAAPGEEATITIVDATGERHFAEILPAESSSTVFALRRKNLGALADWPAVTRLTVIIDGERLTDAHGHAVMNDTIVSFDTGESADTSAPTILQAFPADAQEGVARTAMLWAVASEPLNPSAVTSERVRVYPAGQPTQAVAGVVGYEARDRRITFTPAAPLPAASELIFELGAGLLDASGNERLEVNAITFTTGDNDAPALAASFPADGATGVQLNGAVLLVFSEQVDADSLVISATATADGGEAPLLGAFDYDARTRSAMWTPALGWPAGEHVQLTIAAGLEDQEGIASVDDHVITFAMSDYVHDDDTTPPVAVASAPAGADAHPETEISVQLSEPIAPDSVASSVLTREDDGARVAHALTYDAAASSIRVSPSSPLTGGASYRLVLSGLADLAGNDAEPIAVDFGVEGDAPTVREAHPSDGATVGPQTSVSVVFDEPMAAARIQPESVRLVRAADGDIVLAGLAYDAIARRLELTPAQPLAAGGYRVELAAGDEPAALTDVAGNALGAPQADGRYSLSFTVDTSGPSVASWQPSCGSIIDARDLEAQVFTIRFDRAVHGPDGEALGASAVALRRADGPAEPSTPTQLAPDEVELTPDGALAAGAEYVITVSGGAVRDAATGYAMAADVECRFTTQRVLYASDAEVDAGELADSSSADNAWKRVDVGDDERAGMVWHGGASDASAAYGRDCAFLGGTSRLVTLSSGLLDFAGLTRAEVRLLEKHDVASEVGDSARLELLADGAVIGTLASFHGRNFDQPYTSETYAIGADLLAQGADELRFVLEIAGGSAIDCASGGRGLFVDDIAVVGE